MAPRRLLVAASLAVVLAVVGLLVVAGGLEGERDQAVTRPPAQRYQPSCMSLRLPPEAGILAAGFSRGVFVFAGEGPGGGVHLSIVDLDGMEVVESIALGGGVRDAPRLRILGYDGSRVYYDLMGLLYMAELGGGGVVGGLLPTRGLVAVEGGVAYYFDGSSVGAFSVETGEQLWMHELELYYPPEGAGGTLRGATPAPVGAWILADGSLAVLAWESTTPGTGWARVSYWLVRAGEAGAKAYYIPGYRQPEAAQYGFRAGLHGDAVYLLEWARHPRPGGGAEGFAQLRVVSLDGDSSIVFREVFTDYSWPDSVYLDLVVGEGWVGVGYYSGLGKVSFYRLPEGGDPEVIANLGLEARILGFTKDAIYYVDPGDYNIYWVDDRGRARIMGSLPRGDLGELLLPIASPLIPVLAFKGQAASAAYVEGSTVYIYYQGSLIACTP